MQLCPERAATAPGRALGANTRTRALALGESGVRVGMKRGRVATTPLTDIVGLQKPIGPELFALANVLAR